MSAMYKEEQVDPETPNFKLCGSLPGHTEAISSVKFSPDGQYIASSSADKIIKVWNVLDSTCIYDLSGHTQGISDLAWSKNGKNLVSASDDRTVRIWNIKTGACAGELVGHTDVVFCCNFNHDLTSVISGGFDCKVITWDVGRYRDTAMPIQPRLHSAHKDAVTAVCFNEDSSRFISSSLDGFCYIWDPVSGSILRVLSAAESGASVSFAKFIGKYVLMSAYNNCIYLYDYITNTCIKTYKGHRNDKFCIIATAARIDNKVKWIISGSEDNLIYVWNCKSKTCVQRLEGHNDVVISCDYNPTSNILASASLENDKTIKLWRSDVM